MMNPWFEGVLRNTERKRQGAPGAMPAACASVRECHPTGQASRNADAATSSSLRDRTR